MSLRRILVLAVLVLVAAECPAIEMWTFYGDGSRIGLPSLEVPVEAYPGIPLRSDRIRMRRRAPRPTVDGAKASAPSTVTLREMPGTGQAVPVAPEPENLAPPAAQ